MKYYSGIKKKFCHLQRYGWTQRVLLCLVNQVKYRKTNSEQYHLYGESKIKPTNKYNKTESGSQIQRTNKWQPTPVFLSGESQGWGSLVGCRLWGRTELDTTEATQQRQQQVVISEEREEERGKEDSDIQTTMYKIKKL